MGTLTAEVSEVPLLFLQTCREGFLLCWVLGAQRQSVTWVLFPGVWALLRDSLLTETVAKLMVHNFRD